MNRWTFACGLACAIGAISMGVRVQATTKVARIGILANSQAARALGILVPPSLLLRADEVIQ